MRHETAGRYEQTKQSMALAVAKTQVWEFKEVSLANHQLYGFALSSLKLCSLWVRNVLPHVKTFRYHWVLFVSEEKMVLIDRLI